MNSLSLRGDTSRLLGRKRTDDVGDVDANAAPKSTSSSSMAANIRRVFSYVGKSLASILGQARGLVREAGHRIGQAVRSIFVSQAKTSYQSGFSRSVFHRCLADEIFFPRGERSPFPPPSSDLAPRMERAMTLEGIPRPKVSYPITSETTVAEANNLGSLKGGSTPPISLARTPSQEATRNESAESPRQTNAMSISREAWSLSCLAAIEGEGENAPDVNVRPQHPGAELPSVTPRSLPPALASNMAPTAPPPPSLFAKPLRMVASAISQEEKSVTSKQDGKSKATIATQNNAMQKMENFILLNPAIILGHRSPMAAGVHTYAAKGNIGDLEELYCSDKSQFMEAINDIREILFKNTPLTMALANGRVETPGFLIDVGADINKPDGGFGNTPLIILMGKGRFHRHNKSPENQQLNLIYEKLTSASNIDVKISNKNGNTAMHFAAAHRDNTAIDFLLKNGADINSKNNNGISPYDILNMCHADRVGFLNSECFSDAVRTGPTKDEL